MITEPTATSTPTQIYESIENIQGQVESIQRELSQAVEVWNTTLAGEKEKFEALLARKEMAAAEQDSQWSAQSNLYQERLAEMKAEFDSRMAQADINASRALAELDDSWQRDKLEWGPVAQSAWPAQRQELESKIQTLEDRIVQLENEKALQANQPSADTVHALEKQLLESQDAMAQLQGRNTQSDDLFHACVQALDYQISVLYDLIYHHAEPSVEILQSALPPANDAASHEEPDHGQS